MLAYQQSMCQGAERAYTVCCAPHPEACAREQGVSIYGGFVSIKLVTSSLRNLWGIKSDLLPAARHEGRVAPYSGRSWVTTCLASSIWSSRRGQRPTGVAGTMCQHTPQAAFVMPQLTEFCTSMLAILEMSLVGSQGSTALLVHLR